MIARQAVVAAGATALWLQLGIASAEAQGHRRGRRAAVRRGPLPDHRAAPPRAGRAGAASGRVGAAERAGPATRMVIIPTLGG